MLCWNTIRPTCIHINQCKYK